MLPLVQHAPVRLLLRVARQAAGVTVFGNGTVYLHSFDSLEAIIKHGASKTLLLSIRS